LVSHLLLARDEVVILDMEAGIEHLGRATARAVDKLLIVVEPGRRSVDSAYRVSKLAKDIGLENIAAVGNKVRSPEDKEFLISSLAGFEFLGFVPYDQAIVDADMAGRPLLDASPKVSEAVRDIYQALMATDTKGTLWYDKVKSGH
jgi:CO dehydrogenase maturation factor